MRLLWCCILSMVVMATGYPQGTLDNFHDPQNLDTPDDQDDGQGANANPQGNPQAGSSYFVPTDGSSSSSSSEEVGSDAGSVPAGSVPAGTVGPGGSPVVGAGATGGNAAGAGVQGGGARGGGQQGGGNAGSTDQDSGEQGGALRRDDPSFLSKVQAQPKGIVEKSGSAGKSVGVAIGVLGLVSVATIGIIFAIRKKRDGFLRFYSQASNEL